MSCLLLALPMLACYSHNARMYTWAAFATTGVFLYACLFIKTNKKSDLIFLGIFSLMAAYTHYYCLIAAFWADLFVLVYLFVNKNKSWRSVLAMGVAVFVLFLPWFFVLLSSNTQRHKRIFGFRRFRPGRCCRAISIHLDNNFSFSFYLIRWP